MKRFLARFDRITVVPSICGALLLAATILVAIGYGNATAPPRVQRLKLAVDNYPADARPTRIVLFSDLHMAKPQMPAWRARSIVRQINRLSPDIIIFAGDFMGDGLVGGRYSPAYAVESLSRLHARLGVFAILGNNDSQAAYVAHALKKAHIHLLMNDAAQVGPVTLGGLDGRLAHSPDALKEARIRTYQAMSQGRGVRILISHSPDEFPVAPGFVQLVLAGHTHCGQIVLPFIGALATGSNYGSDYLCGVFRNGHKVLVVTAGVGTSHLPLRIGTYPDIWLISLKGPTVARH
jgi:predicted MPP superfamily phosphohydrolase